MKVSFFACRLLFFVLCLSSVLLLGACQRPAVERIGAPWNTSQMRDRVKEFMGEDAPAPSPLPAQDTVLGYADCIFTAAQHAPDLVEGVVSLELADLDAESSSSKRLPTFHADFRINHNITNKHEEYKGTAMRPYLVIKGYHPVVSHFTHNANLLLQDIALHTQYIALEKRASQIGETLIRLEYLANKRKLLEEYLAVARRSKEYQRVEEGSAVNALERAKARHQESKALAELEKNTIESANLLSSLKVLMGIDLDRKLVVRSGDVSELLRRRKASSIFADMSWEPVWTESPEARMTRASRQLSKENVAIAWTNYLPDFTLEFYSLNPADQYMAYSPDDDIFASLNYSLPLWDWGERYRGVEKARLETAQASQRLKLSRQKFAGDWSTAWQDMKIAAAEVDVARHTLAASALDAQRADLEFRSGILAYSAAAKVNELRIENAIALETEIGELRLKEFAAWILSGGFRREFIEPGSMDRLQEQIKARNDAPAASFSQPGGTQAGDTPVEGGGAGQRERRNRQESQTAKTLSDGSAADEKRPDAGAWNAAAKGLDAPEADPDLSVTIPAQSVAHQASNTHAAERPDGELAQASDGSDKRKSSGRKGRKGKKKRRAQVEQAVAANARISSAADTAPADSQ